ncbi:acyclic terpene utilization AtuA family protein [Actinomadura sp. 1N219]|uniref:acyclic terpene utilization AtuA family protein n=1 Tax=Actinomadura sp. 1N219 TaxID=3375152 RepID=UPI0037BBBCF7
MSAKSVRIGSGSAYWGDAVEPAVELAERGDVEYIAFDLLAELTMSIFQRARMRDPAKGFIRDTVQILERVLPAAARRGVRLIINGGAANPEAAGRAVRALADDLGLPDLRIATVTGDDILGRLDELADGGWAPVNLDTGERGLDGIRDRLVAAHAYIGSEAIVAALAEGADVVVTGRVADSSLYVAPMMHEFGWSFDDPDWDRLGAAVTLAHIVECSACCTGGMSNQWESVREPWRIGFPIVEVTDGPDGVRGVIGKVPGSGGLVNEWTIKEHLLYEVQDPANYLMPDAVADFTTLALRDLGGDRVEVTGMSGRPRPGTLKAQLGFEDGWLAEGLVVQTWPRALDKARHAERFLRRRYEDLKVGIDTLDVSYLGLNSVLGGTAPVPADLDPPEVCLRVAARTPTRADADAVRREITHLWTLGPVGSAFGSPMPLRQVVGLWPTLVPRAAVRPVHSFVDGAQTGSARTESAVSGS